MIKENLYKSPPQLSGALSPDNLQIWETHKETTLMDKPKYYLRYTLVYVTKNNHSLPILKPFRHLERVKQVKDELLGYFHNPLEHHSEDEIKLAKHILKYSLVRTNAVKPIMRNLNLTERKSKALIAKILYPNEYNPIIYGIDTYYRGFDFYNHRIWETGQLAPLRRPKYNLIKTLPI